MRLKLKRIALATALAALATQAAIAANVQDMSKVMTLLDRWQQVATPQGSESAVWRDMMRIQLEQVSPATLDRLLAIGAGAKRQSLGEFYGTFINTIGSDIQARLGAQKGQTQKAPESAAIQQPTESVPTVVAGVSPKALGSTSSDQVFTPITPCRVVDTRNLGGPIGPFATRNFFYFTSSASTNWTLIQGGVNGAAGTVCPGTVLSGFLPSSAVATITVTGQGGSGNLIVWQGTNPLASASTMSYPASGDTSSLATIPAGGRSGTGPGGTVEDFGVFVNAFTGTNVVVDIVGYYSAPAATALVCSQTAKTTVSIATAGVINFNVAATCPVGTTEVTLNCRGESSFGGTEWLQVGQRQSGASGDCQGLNASGITQNYTGTRTCCGVPGH